MHEIIEYEDHAPAFADDVLVRMAEQAEKRIDAVIKIKQTALKVTNSGDWVDQNGKPYLQASGAEKIGNLFNVSWRIEEPVMDPEEDGHYTYTYRGTFSMAGRSIQVEGSRSSKDGFFRQYDYPKGGQKTEKPVYDRDNKRDVKMAALTNLLGNGITRLLGIRNLTYADLEAFAGIKRDQLGKVEYKTEKKESTVQRKSDSPPATNGDAITTAQVRAINTMLGKAGVKDDQRHTFVASMIGHKIESMNNLTKAEASTVIDRLQNPDKAEPLPEGVPKDCPKNPMSCEHSGWAEGKAFCGPDGAECGFQGE